MSEKLSEQLYTLAGALKTTNRARGIAIARIAKKVAAIEQQLAAKDAEITRLQEEAQCRYWIAQVRAALAKTPATLTALALPEDG